MSKNAVMKPNDNGDHTIDGVSLEGLGLTSGAASMSFILPSAITDANDNKVIFPSRCKYSNAEFVYLTLIDMGVYKHKGKYLFAMGNLFYNLKLASLCAVRDGMPTRLVVPCRTSDYSVPHQYGEYSQLLSHPCTKKCVEELERRSLIEVFSGWFDVERGRGRRTTLLPTEEFHSLALRSSDPVSELGLGGGVLLKDTKDNDKRLLPFEPTELTTTTCERLERINAINALAFELPATEGIPPFIYESSPFRYKRIFNDGSWEHGGRFYAPFQNLPAAKRLEMRCQGERVRELDYGGMQLRMLYHLEGMELTEDPYTFPNLDVSRENMKKVCLIALNAKSMQQAHSTLRLKPGFSHLANRSAVVINAFKEKHAPIQKHFTSGIGIKLQRKDSDIALEIMWHFASQSKPCLSVHDSFIVAAKDVEELRDVMVQAYVASIGYYPVIKDDRGTVVFPG